uniref:Protein FAM151A-like n=1 Tax=Phallusia mammillata TaxID=59560 RepID=A0A6F9DCY8_9ASCI|nr:protein FAM151A-like [Phallusia mammillata]
MEDYENEKSKNSDSVSSRHKIFKYTLGIIIILVSLGFTIGVLYSIIDHYTNVNVYNPGDNTTTTTTITTTVTTSTALSSETPSATPIENETIFKITGGDLLEYFPDAHGDGLNLKFYHGANSKSEMNDALEGDYDILEADISLSPDTNQPIMAHPPITTSDNTLDEWFAAVTASNKGIKMDIKSNEVIPPALQSLRSFVTSLQQPVWINSDVVQGPNNNNKPINGTFFVSNVNAIFPNVTLSLGWTTTYRFVGENELYSWESMDEMFELVENLNQRITFPARAALVRKSWDRFLWLLEQNNRFSLTIWTGSTDPVDTVDMVFVRDNCGLDRVFYDAYDSLTEPLLHAIETSMYPKVFYSGGNALDYLRIPNREAINVTWAHRVNSHAELQAALQDDNIMMLEADVRLSGEGTSNVDESLPVMAHDIIDASTSNFSLSDFLQQITTSQKTKGAKLDFKSIGAVTASVEILQKQKSNITFPVWLNADILLGPNSVTEPVDATNYFSTIVNKFPDCTFSPGWTTAYRPVGVNELYTQQTVEEMYGHVSSLRQAITFPVRASLTRPSLPALQWLVSKSNRYSLTVWHSSPTPEGVTSEDLYEIYLGFPAHKVYFDIPETMMEGLKQLIAKKST